MVDKDRVEGSGRQAKGEIKKKAGEWTGDAGLEAEGEIEKQKGKAQNTWGNAKDKLRGK